MAVPPKKPLPSKDELHRLFAYADGRLIRKVRTRSKAAGTDACVTDKAGYVTVTIKRTTYMAHRLVWAMFNEDPGQLEVDHIDCVRSNNRIENLRLTTRSGNNQNQRCAHPSNSCGFLGVSFHKATGKFNARIQHKGRLLHLGLFDTPEAAHTAYVSRKRQLHSTCTL